MPENRLLTALREALRHVLEGLGLAAPPIHYVGGSDTLPPPLPRDKEDDAITRPCRGATRAQSQLLIEHNLRLVVYICAQV